MRLLPFFLCGLSAWAAAGPVTLSFDLQNSGTEQDDSRLDAAEADALRLLDSAAMRTEFRSSVRLQAPGWSADVAEDVRRRELSALSAEWGSRFHVEEGNSPAVERLSAQTPPLSETVSVAVPQGLLSGHQDAVYDGRRESGASLSVSEPAEASESGASVTSVLDPAAMDRQADPCVDFYEYSCGSWLKANPVPDDQSSWYRFSQIDERTSAVLRDILEKAAATDKLRSANEQKIGDLYASCMDEKAVEAAGLSPVRPLLAKIAGMTSLSQLPSVLAELHLAGVGAAFSFGAIQDFQDASKMTAKADQGGISLPDPDYYSSPDFSDSRTGFLAHVQKMLELAGDDPKNASAEAASVMAVESDLAKTSLNASALQDTAKLHHRMTLAQLKKTTPSFDWSVYLAALGAPAFKDLDVAVPPFFGGLEATLAAEPLDSWKAYLRWQTLHENAAHLPKAFDDENFAFFGKTLTGQKKSRARWKRCVSLVDDKLGEALGPAYVKRQFGAEQKAHALEMMQSIEAEMRKNIRQAPWMSDATKKQALIKLKAVGNKIGYPDAWRDYRALHISRGDLIGDVAAANAFEMRRQLGKIGKASDRSEWTMTPPTDNAEYVSERNDVTFPAGILQPPLFDGNADPAANYGATGATMGHELTHGFDADGRHYDSIGNVKDWWTPKDAAQFEARADQFVKQYSGYAATSDPDDPGRDIKVDGKLTIDENIADNGGIRLAYMAFERRRARQPSSIDGLDPEQRFFVSYGQSWCANVRPESLKRLNASDPHAPPRSRVEGVISNMPEFQKAFTCPDDSPMVRKKPNRVW